MKTERNSLTDIFIATGWILIGYFLLMFAVFGQCAPFWLLITGLLACKLTYGKTLITKVQRCRGSADLSSVGADLIIWDGHLSILWQ
ncbi:MAG: hypothetical protein ACK5MW_04555 [Enterococcus sp.]